MHSTKHKSSNSKTVPRVWLSANCAINNIISINFQNMIFFKILGAMTLYTWERHLLHFSNIFKRYSDLAKVIFLINPFDTFLISVWFHLIWIFSKNECFENVGFDLYYEVPKTKHILPFSSPLTTQYDPIWLLHFNISIST